MTTIISPELAVRVQASSISVEACFVDGRADAIAFFEDLGPDLQRQLALDAWSIGLRALGNARAQAREARLTEIGDRLVADVEAKLDLQLTAHQQALAASLARFFDPADGTVTHRLAEFVSDEGSLARQLAKHVGPFESVLADTLARVIGDTSPLLRRLSLDGDDSVVKAIEQRLAQTLASGQQDLARALDPTADDGPVRRFLVSLRDELAKADQDRDRQLASALAALNAADETSLISRLFRETQQARISLLSAINPDLPHSPMAAIRSSLEELLARNAARQEQLATETREAIARLDTRRTQESKSPRGGLTFEDAVADFIVAAVTDGPYLAEPTGNAVGEVSRCKKGDLVVRFTQESAFAGANVVFEAKRDGSFTLARALEELDQARKNRNACVGVFVMAVSHAPPGFPRFARHGNNVVVQWDDGDPMSDAYLRCALYLGMGLVGRSRPAGNPADARAVQDLAERIEAEIDRLERMEKLNEAGRRSVEGIALEVRKARQCLERMLLDTQSTVRALHLDVIDESAEARTPITFVDPSRDPAPSLRVPPTTSPLHP